MTPRKTAVVHDRWHYATRKCRCDECRADFAAYNRERRAELARKLASGSVKVPHGTPSTYENYGCRCKKCTIAARDKKRQVRS